MSPGHPAPAADGGRPPRGPDRRPRGRAVRPAPREYEPDPPDDPEAIEDDRDAGEEPEARTWSVGGRGGTGRARSTGTGSCSPWSRRATGRARAASWSGAAGRRSSSGRSARGPRWDARTRSAAGPRPTRSPTPSGSPRSRCGPGPTTGWTGEPLYGEQRLRLRIGVTRAVRAVTITYAQFTELGVVPLPRIDVRPGDGG